MIATGECNNGCYIIPKEISKKHMCAKVQYIFYACRHLVDMPSLDKRSIGNDEFSRLWNPLGRSLSIYWAFMTLRQESTINLSFINTFLLSFHFSFFFFVHMRTCYNCLQKCSKDTAQTKTVWHPIKSYLYKCEVA